MPEKISLSDTQREQAISILRRLSNGDVTTPTDILNEWDSPDASIRWGDRADGDTFPQTTDYIDPSKIGGSVHSSYRLNQSRLGEKLKLMIEGDYDLHRNFPPVLQKWGDTYYVTTDGHHRCMAAKAIGLDRLYVEVGEVPPELLEV